ncbi:MAG: NUDIX domain-containing protein [Clostridiales bacterium]|nr:NUDIX domain-containing protein [Clostridiales bacterium]
MKAINLKLLKRRSIGMIHVNVRGLLVREIENEKQLIIQLRKREGEPEVYELPGGRINEYEKIVDGLKREIKEETGLSVKSIRGEKSAIVAAGDSFTMECIKPFSAYQTLEGPVDSFGIHFICEVEGELLTTGDDTADIHWASKKDVQQLIDEHKFSEIDLPAVLMFLRDEN